MTGPRAVLFDIDGTLVDSNERHVRIWREAFRKAGHHVDEAAIRGQIGKGGDQLVPALIPDAEEDEVKRLSDAHGTLFKQRFLHEVPAFPDARALIARVHADGRKVVLASSASKGELKHYIDLLDVRDMVDASTTIDDVEQSKPAPDIFAVALDKAGVPAADAVVIGDSPFDGETAKRCGIAFVAVRSGGFSDDALREAGAAAIYDDVAALLAGFDASPLA